MAAPLGRGPVRHLPRAAVPERAVHHQRVDVAAARVEDGAGQAAQGREAHALPEGDRALVGGDDEIELHRPEAALSRPVARMRAHRPGDPLAPRRLARPSHGRSCTHAPRRRSGSREGNRCRARRRRSRRRRSRGPARANRRAPRASEVLARDRVGLARADHRLQDRPDRGAVGGRRGTDGQGRGGHVGVQDRGDRTLRIFRRAGQGGAPGFPTARHGPEIRSDHG